eukprot:jgi/Undpi1/8752/HiC_scaffold_25.g11214.m1
MLAESLRHTRWQGSRVAHVVTTSVVAGPTLRVEAETEDGEWRWRGEFPAKYVEGITQKTGSAKKFPVFVKMLLTALGHGSDSVFIDLLTYADLEVLKARRAGVVGGDSGNIAQQHRQQQQQQGTGGFGGTTNSGGGASGGNGSGNNKRYMILTYAAEYDRVHYPLPLACVASPEREEPDRTADSPGEVDFLAARLAEAEASARRNGRGDGTDVGEEGKDGGEAETVISCRGPGPTRKKKEIYQYSGGGGRGYKYAELNDLRETHERLQIDSAAEIRKLIREAREATRTARSEASAAAEEADQHAASLREQLEDSAQRLRRSKDEHRREVDQLKKDLARGVRQPATERWRAVNVGESARWTCFLFLGCSIAPVSESSREGAKRRGNGGRLQHKSEVAVSRKACFRRIGVKK